ncbi:MAG TPA: DUF4915 domain-containing protein [Gaiellaceae bacterium]|nr:DUF4915 domain-containing protein [Gaiellaceae bacterium]
MERDDERRAAHDAAWRAPEQVVAHWADAGSVDASLVEDRARGRFWELVDELEVSLLVSREYEHLLVCLSTRKHEPVRTFMPLPHPSGIAFDGARGVVHVASTRNPNQVFELASLGDGRPLVPVASRFYPGALYLHDLALVGGTLHGNAVGLNAVVRFDDGGRVTPVWWPASVDRGGWPDVRRNYLQLNSIAAGRDLRSSFFSASAERPSGRRPGHRNFPVDGRGVVFSGRTGGVHIRGLTRPHSARLVDGVVWVLNSGYGELGYGSEGRFEPVAALPGWTRGLAFHGPYAFVATSRVIPRYARYAPGLDVDRSVCGLHAFDLRTSELIGSLLWPKGNQVFAVEVLPRTFAGGLPFTRRSRPAYIRRLLYTYDLGGIG